MTGGTPMYSRQLISLREETLLPGRPQIHKKDNNMSKIVGIYLALTIGLAALSILVISASAAPVNHGPAVYGDIGLVIGHDPDPFIRSMLQRDRAQEQGQ
jgi:hypothetical protein